jgi:hypothetical protein
VLLELDDENPLKARELIVRDVVDLRDVSLVNREDDDGAGEGAYRGVARDIPSIVDSLPFLRTF